MRDWVISHSMKESNWWQQGNSILEWWTHDHVFRRVERQRLLSLHHTATSHTKNSYTRSIFIPHKGMLNTCNTVLEEDMEDSSDMRYRSSHVEKIVVSRLDNSETRNNCLNSTWLANIDNDSYKCTRFNQFIHHTLETGICKVPGY